MTSFSATCHICGTIAEHPRFVGREMMFGTREEFDYFQCIECGCLQILNIPTDLSRHYPPTYTAHNIKPTCERNYLRILLDKQRFRNAIFNRGYKLNKFLSFFLPMPVFRIDGVLQISRVLRVSHIKNFSARFLDVGCGNWSLWLEKLRRMGFKNLSGVDPLISNDVQEFGIRILKESLDKVTGQFDLITLHHSLEHIPNQREILTAARNRLAPNGVILVRIPIVSSYVWEKYGTNWIEMDPPRHLYLHSKKSIELLGQQVGLELFEIIHDSMSFEFWGSEQYQRDIPLSSNNSYWINPSSSVFKKFELDAFDKLALEVNRNGSAGRSAFFFRLTRPS
jgi:2-polyprenyl-3-methyl-5-hydroxy-6-metoxy-1,4-benzoquinol methylase